MVLFVLQIYAKKGLPGKLKGRDYGKKVIVNTAWQQDYIKIRKATDKK